MVGPSLSRPQSIFLELGGASPPTKAPLVWATKAQLVKLGEIEMLNIARCTDCNAINGENALSSDVNYILAY